MTVVTLAPPNNEPKLSIGRKIRLHEILLLLLSGSVFLNLILVARLQHHDVTTTQSLSHNDHSTHSSVANLPGDRRRRDTAAAAAEGAAASKALSDNAPMRCEPFGGPFNQAAVEDIVYWRDDIPRENQFRSVYLPDAAKTYFVFEPDEAGFSNVRLSFETVVAFSVAMGRTLVMVPKLRLAQLLHPHKEGTRSYSYYDFFNIRNVPVISMQQYLETVALKGNLHDPSDKDAFPPNNKTIWDGLIGNSGNSGVGEGPALFKYLSESMHALDWKRDDCIVPFPADRKKGVVDVRQFVSSILKEDEQQKDGLSKRINGYTGNPIPVDSSPRDRFREMMSERRTLCEYDDYWRRSESLYLTGHESTGSRPLIQFFAYIYFEDWKQDLQMKRFMRDNLRFSDVIQCAAARIVEAVREIARTSAVNGSNPVGSFDTMHVRRTDFMDLGTYKDGIDDAAKIVADNYFPDGRTIYIATDEKDRSFFGPMQQHYNVVFLHDFDHLIQGVDPNMFGMIEQLVCAKGDKFVGTYYSTFTAYINRVRGYHAQKGRSAEALKGSLNSEYMGHKGNYRHQLKTYNSARKDFWSREWPGAWRDIDHNT